MTMASENGGVRKEAKTLPTLEDLRGGRRFVEEEPKNEFLSPPLKAETTSFPSLQKQRSTLHRRRSILDHKPLVVNFMRNGDRFFEGVKLNISQRSIRSWGNLLAELSRRIELPAGVRNIYTANGGHRVRNLSELEHGKTYVCGSTEPFKRMDYGTAKNPDWKPTSKAKQSDAALTSVFSLPLPLDLNLSSSTSFGNLNSSVRDNMEKSKDETSSPRRISKRKSMRLVSLTESAVKSPEEPFKQSVRSLSKLSVQASTSQHKVFLIYRNAPAGKRECVRIYLNKSMVKSWEEAKRIISENLNTINGFLRLFDLEGKEVESLSHLWAAGSHLVAAGREEFNLSSFLLGVPDMNGLTEVHPEHSLSLPNSSWSSSSVIPSIDLSQSSPRKAILQGRPLPVIQETMPNTVEEYTGKLELSFNESNTTAALVKDTDEDHRSPEIESKVVMEEATGITGEDSQIILTSSMTKEPEAYESCQSCSEKVLSSSESELLVPQNEEKIEESTPIQRPVEVEGSCDASPVSKLSTSNTITLQTEAQQIPTEVVVVRNPPIAGALSGEVSQEDGPCSSASVPAMEDKIWTSTSSSDVSLLHHHHRRDSMFVNFHFPPSPSSVEPSTPETGSPVQKTRRLRKKMSLLQEVQNGNLSKMSDSNDFQTSPQRVLPRTPLSEVSLGALQSVVDMVLPREDESGSSLMSEPPVHRPAVRRNVAIQTSYADDQLFTTIEAEEEERASSEAKCRMSQRGSMDVSVTTALLYKKNRDKYRLGMVIEEGSFAAVKSCVSKEDRQDYLLRVVHKGKVFMRDDKILQEIKILRMLRHDNVMGVVDYWETSSEHCMVMEPIEGGDLYDTILYCQHFSERDAMLCARQLGLALVYLHANMIIHRNVKPENIFLTLGRNQWTLKLAGFSLATKATEPLTLECGNEYYRAPEMASGTGYGAKADVWSAGIITYILLSGVMPFSKKRKAKAGLSFPKWYWGEISPEAKDFVQCLLKFSPSERHSSSQLLQHSWFKMELQDSSDPTLPQKLILHLTAQAKMKISPVLMLTETALNAIHRQSSKRHQVLSK